MHNGSSIDRRQLLKAAAWSAPAVAVAIAVPAASASPSESDLVLDLGYILHTPGSGFYWTGGSITYAGPTGSPSPISVTVQVQVSYNEYTSPIVTVPGGPISIPVGYSRTIGDFAIPTEFTPPAGITATLTIFLSVAPPSASLSTSDVLSFSS